MHNKSESFPNHLEIWYGQKRVDMFARLRGEGKHAINYRHIIDSLIRKPGAFENYRYREWDNFTHRCIGVSRIECGESLAKGYCKYMDPDGDFFGEL